MGDSGDGDTDPKTQTQDPSGQIRGSNIHPPLGVSPVSPVKKLSFYIDIIVFKLYQRGFGRVKAPPAGDSELDTGCHLVSPTVTCETHFNSS